MEIGTLPPLHHSSLGVEQSAFCCAGMNMVARRSAAPGKDAERLQEWQAEHAQAHVRGASGGTSASGGVLSCMILRVVRHSDFTDALMVCPAGAAAST